MRIDPEDELAREIQAHLEAEAEDLVSDGMSEHEARLAARRAFGNVTRVKEDARAAWSAAWIDEVKQDAVLTVRSLRRTPGFTLTVILVLALGTGANTSVYSLLDTLLLQLAPVTSPERLVFLRRGEVGNRIPWADYAEYQKRTNTLAGLGSTFPFESDLAVEGQAAIVTAEAVSANYGEVIGAQILVGRWFDRDDEPVAVISASAWSRWFSRAPDVIGRSIESGPTSYTIVGVVAPTFTGGMAPLRTDVWIPQDVWARQLQGPGDGPRRRPDVLVYGRLRADMPLAPATEELNAIDQQLSASRPASTMAQEPLVLESVRGVAGPAMRGASTVGLSALGIVAGLVLATACFNVGNLLLVRGSDRQREIATRAALGASRGRLFRQLLTEALAMALLGAACGVALAGGVNALLMATLPTLPFGFPIQLELSIGWRALAFALCVACVATALAGVAPAWRTSQSKGFFPLRDVSPPPSQTRGQTVSAVAQIAVSLVLLLTAGAFLRGLSLLQDTDPGFSYADLAYATTFIAPDTTDPAERAALYRQILEQTRSLPSARNVALTSFLPLAPTGTECLPVGDGREIRATTSAAGDGFFSVMGIPLVAGREFRESDATRSPVVIVNESLARQIWPNGEAVGRTLALGCGDRTTAEVVGVARNSVIGALGQAIQPHVYRSIDQGYRGLTTLVAAGRASPADTTSALRSTLREFGDRLRVYEVGPVADHVARSYWAVRWQSRMLGIFAVLVLGLAALGLHGVIAYRVALQMRSMGIRLALGARPRRVVADILRSGVLITSIGMMIGIALAIPLSRIWPEAELGIAPPSATTYLGVSALWMVTTIVACLLPARRAATIDPALVLRAE